MGKYPKVVQCDARGQIVIPKNIRASLKIEEGAAFWMYETPEGIFLERIQSPSEKPLKKIIKEVKER